VQEDQWNPETGSYSLFPYPSQEREADERFTPAWVFDGLGMQFDLDPASPIGIETFVPARVKLTREDDGLDAEWHGSVWCNPPFSAMTKWADKFIAHGNGILLGPVADSAWTLRALHAADAVYIAHHLRFWHQTYKGTDSAFPMGLFAMGPDAVIALERASRLWGTERGALLVRA
jgi:hypothetical protein